MSITLGGGRDDNTGYGLLQAKDAVDLIDERGCGGNGDFNHRPTISGNPGSRINEAEHYQFVPTASDADAGDTLIFSIGNKPGWTSFNPLNGSKRCN